MATYQKILVAVDLSSESELVLQKAQLIAGPLTALGENMDVSSGNLHILNGSPAHEIHRFANENGVQLIVIGTHGQKGLQLLLGSTANAVLHGAGCDVLSVRIGAAT
jgi:universal stress protein A